MYLRDTRTQIEKISKDRESERFQVNIFDISGKKLYSTICKRIEDAEKTGEIVETFFHTRWLVQEQVLKNLDEMEKILRDMRIEEYLKTQLILDSLFELERFIIKIHRLKDSKSYTQEFNRVLAFNNPQKRITDYF